MPWVDGIWQWHVPPSVLQWHAEADAAYPGTPRSAGNCSDVDRALSIFVEVTLVKALTGEQLGEKKVFDLSRADERCRGWSLGSLLAMGKKHEQAEGEAANYKYFFVQADGRHVDCKARVYDKIVDYVDSLDLIPVEEGSGREADSRYHRLDLLQYAYAPASLQRALIEAGG